MTQPMRPLIADVPAGLVELVVQCLALEPGARPASARDVADALGADTVALGAVTARGVRASVAPPVAPAPTPAAQASSLAVLPVACAAGDEYLADGVLDDVIDTLSSSSIRVRPAGLVRSVQAPDPREVGRQLEVDHVATIAMRRTPSGLRVTARLISVTDGFQVWAHRVDCGEAEVLAVADELARGIAQALSTRASPAARSIDPRAVDLYLRARAELRRFWGVHAAAAAELLDRAAEFAPDNEQILASRALANVQAWVMTTEPKFAPRARAAMERGLATGHGEALLAAGIYKLNCGHPEAAAVDLATALVRAPMSAPVHESAARMLVEVESLAAARGHFETALGLDPGRANIIATDLARLDALSGDYASAAARVAPLVADRDPSVVQLGSVVEARMSAWRGEPAEMMRAAARFVPRMGENGGLIHQFITNITHDPTTFDNDTWRTFLVHFESPDRPLRQQLMGLQLLTEVALSAQRIEPALDTLAQAALMGLMDIVWLDACPLLRPLAPLPRFATIRTEVAARALRVLTAFRSVEDPSR